MANIIPGLQEEVGVLNTMAYSLRVVDFQGEVEEWYHLNLETGMCTALLVCLLYNLEHPVCGLWIQDSWTEDLNKEHFCCSTNEDPSTIPWEATGDITDSKELTKLLRHHQDFTPRIWDKWLLTSQVLYTVIELLKTARAEKHWHVQ